MITVLYEIDFNSETILHCAPNWCVGSKVGGGGGGQGGSGHRCKLYSEFRLFNRLSELGLVTLRLFVYIDQTGGRLQNEMVFVQE